MICAKTGQADMDWKAKWIWKDSGIRVNDFSYFRKEYYIESSVRSARVFVSAHNHFELYINSIKVSGYVTPAPTHPEKSKYYLSYDIGSLLKSGMNVFCAVVHYIGGNGQNYVNGLPGFILQCHVDYIDGKQDIFYTDDAWKAQAETPFENGTEFQQNRRISAIENYDARKEQSGWLQSGFDDSLWKEAALSSINGECWVMTPQAIPEGKANEMITPAPVSIQEKGLQVFDAGKIVTGWPRIELPGIRGMKVMMRYSESIDGRGRVMHNVCNEKSENYYDCYIMNGEKVESWEPCFSYKAFRFIEVTGYPEIIKPENIKIISAGTCLTYKGIFNSSSHLLNDIYNACIQTQRNNVVGQMVDCPHREQAQYLADSDLQAESFIYNFTENSVLEKVLLDFKDIQNADGSLPFVFPTNVENSDFDIKIPEWDLHFITLLWKVYYAYDNKDILEKCYKTAKKIISHFLGQKDKDTGLIPKAEGFPKGWNISDWPYPNIDETGRFLAVENCLLFHDLDLMGKIACILGFTDDMTEFNIQASSLRDSIIKHLYNPDIKLFMDSFGSSQNHQGTNVVAYQYGLVPEEDRGHVLDFVINEGFNCSTLLSLNLLQVLFENGKGCDAYNLLNHTEQPGWGYMISKGYKTMWEGFQDIESHSHAWNAYPARIFVEYIVGVKAASPGFKEIKISPYIPFDMKYAEGRVPTIYGDIYARWEKKGCNVILTVDIPSGNCAHVFLPGYDTGERVIKESGTYIFKKQ